MRLWDCVIEIIRNGERWEYADEVMDVLGSMPGSIPSFVKRLNGYLSATGVSLRVPLVGELRKDGLSRQDAHQAQSKALSLALNRLFEAIHEEPEKAVKVVPVEYHDKREMERIDAMREAYEAEAREIYGDAAPVGLGDAEPPVWDDTHEALLECPNLLEMLVAWGDAQVRDVSDLWLAIWLSLASVHAPPIRQGVQVHNPQCDILLVGEISTAKSGILGLVKAIAPKGMAKTAFTPVAFTGRVDKSGIFQPGIAYRANGGILCVDELDKLLIRFPVLDGIIRMVQTEHHVDYETALGMVDYDTTIGIIAGANPSGDVFGDSAIRAQVPFAEGLLSRYAFIKPLAYSPEKVNAIADFMADTWFSDAPRDNTLTVETIRSTYAALWHRLRGIKSVTVSRDLRLALANHFTENQESISGVPLLTTRDLEAAFKWLNASAALHIAQRQVADNAIVATVQDLDNAMAMLDSCIAVRKAMLSNSRSAIVLTPVERAASILRREMELGHLNRTDAVQTLMASMGISQATAYRYLDELAKRHEIQVNGRYKSSIGLAQA